MEGIAWFSYEILKRMVRNHPECQFIFFFDRAYSEEFVFAKNVLPVVLHPQARHPFLYYLWFEWSVNRALKKYRADVFLSPDGFLSLPSKVPSISVIHDINFLHHPKNLPSLTRKYYNYYFPRFARKASRVVTVSQYSKEDICENYGVAESKVDVIYNGLRDGFYPLEQAEKLEVQKKWTKGQPYFIYVGALINRKNLSGLFQAFDKFLKSSERGYKLVVVGDAMWGGAYLEQAIENLVNKSEVIFTGHLNQKELNELLAAAEALTFVPFFEGFGVPIIEAFAAETAVITSNTTSMPEVAGDAALLVDPHSADSIANSMSLLVSDDELRKKIIEKGKERLKLFDWDRSAEQLWESIEKVLSNRDGQARNR